MLLLELIDELIGNFPSSGVYVSLFLAYIAYEVGARSYRTILRRVGLKGSWDKIEFLYPNIILSMYGKDFLVRTIVNKADVTIEVLPKRIDYYLGDCLARATLRTEDIPSKFVRTLKRVLRRAFWQLSL